MSTLGSIKTYDEGGQKGNWRRSIWNEVLRRISDERAIGPILYLPGPGDVDRKIAISKGVRTQDLIAIDSFKPTAMNIRRTGVPALHAKVEAVVQVWQDERPVAGVLLDFPCGFEKAPVCSAVVCMTRKPFQKSVVMFNLKRGRDLWSNNIRSGLASIGPSHDSNLLIQTLLDIRAPGVEWKSPLSRSPKNRAL